MGVAQEGGAQRENWKVEKKGKYRKVSGEDNWRKSREVEEGGVKRRGEEGGGNGRGGGGEGGEGRKEEERKHRKQKNGKM